MRSQASEASCDTARSGHRSSGFASKYDVPRVASAAGHPTCSAPPLLRMLHLSRQEVSSIRRLHGLTAASAASAFAAAITKREAWATDDVLNALGCKEECGYEAFANKTEAHAQAHASRAWRTSFFSAETTAREEQQVFDKSHDGLCCLRLEALRFEYRPHRSGSSAPLLLRVQS